MQLELWRFSSGLEDSLGCLFEVGTSGRTFLCFTLEDEKRETKVHAETRIPIGRYQLKLRVTGGFHGRYGARFPRMHRGMLWLQDVPGFEYILIHVGNTDADTAGCILVGDGAHQNVVDEGSIDSSVAAYRRIYPPIAAALEAGEPTFITVIDFDTGVSP